MTNNNMDKDGIYIVKDNKIIQFAPALAFGDYKVIYQNKTPFEIQKNEKMRIKE